MKKENQLIKKSFCLYGISLEALQWINKKSQDRRFKQIVADVDFEGKIILDAGCGFGDNKPNNSVKATKIEYFSIVVIKEFIAVTKETYKTRMKMNKNIKKS